MCIYVIIDQNFCTFFSSSSFVSVNLLIIAVYKQQTIFRLRFCSTVFLFFRKYKNKKLSVFWRQLCRMFTTMSRNNSMEIYAVKVEILEILFTVRCLQFILRFVWRKERNIKETININSLSWLTLLLLL